VVLFNDHLKCFHKRNRTTYTYVLHMYFPYCGFVIIYIQCLLLFLSSCFCVHNIFDSATNRIHLTSHK
jgi:hypothetical protein